MTYLILYKINKEKSHRIELLKYYYIDLIFGKIQVYENVNMTRLVDYLLLLLREMITVITEATCLTFLLAHAHMSHTTHSSVEGGVFK